MSFVIKQQYGFFSTKKLPEIQEAFSGGQERIRTAVEGFADLCLAARPLDHVVMGCKHKQLNALSKFFSL